MFMLTKLHPNRPPQSRAGSPRRRSFLLLASFFGIAAAAVVAGSMKTQSGPSPDDRALQPFRSESSLSQKEYEALALYFVRGFEHNQTAEGAGAIYAGVP